MDHLIFIGYKKLYIKKEKLDSLNFCVIYTMWIFYWQVFYFPDFFLFNVFMMDLLKDYRMKSHHFKGNNIFSSLSEEEWFFHSLGKNDDLVPQLIMFPWPRNFVKRFVQKALISFLFQFWVSSFKYVFIVFFEKKQMLKYTL